MRKNTVARFFRILTDEKVFDTSIILGMQVRATWMSGNDFANATSETDAVHPCSIRPLHSFLFRAVAPLSIYQQPILILAGLMEIGFKIKILA